MANMKTDDSGIITTEFFTGRCPVRCELCFVNFGQNGASVPFTIYSRQSEKVFSYANCTTTLERLRKDRKQGHLDWVKDALCGPSTGLPGRNNQPRRWEPVTGVDAVTGKPVKFWPGMTADDFKEVLKPLTEDPGLYQVPKVPESPWMMEVPATRTYNGQWLPSVLRVSSMSDSSVAPTEWIARIREIWGDNCFFNTNVHALIMFPENIRAGLFHKVVVTANPGLQHNHAGLNRYLLHYRTKSDVASDPEVVLKAEETYPHEDFGGDIQNWLVHQTWEILYGLITLRLGADTMVGTTRDRPWHFFNPALLSDVRPEFAKFEGNVKFYRIRALPTIQPHVDRFEGHPIVYTVLRFKTVAQACEFANKYDIEIECVVHSVKDKVVCDYYGVPCTMAAEDETTSIRMRDNSELNGSPNRGQWTVLRWEGNFFRAGKSQMSEMQFVCDRASKSCKACGLCATLDGTEENWTNPVLGAMGLVPQEYNHQDRYLCDMQGEPVPTMGVVGKVSRYKYDMGLVDVGIGRSQAEQDFFYGEGGRQFWSFEEAEKDRKQKERQAQRRQKNPNMTIMADGAVPGEVADPAIAMLTIMEAFSGRRRNPGGSEVLLASMEDTLRLAVDYGTQGTQGPGDFWWQGWDTHEEIATMVAYVFWWLMVMAHEDGLDEDVAFEDAREFSYNSCEMDMFADDFVELSLMYYNRSYWTDQFGPTF
jgi:hypothetical protein